MAGLDAGLLQPLGNGQHQRQMSGDSLAAESVHLEADDFVRPGDDVLPGFDRVVAAGVGGDGAVEQIEHTLFVELAVGS